jgi:MFS family permease
MRSLRQRVDESTRALRDVFRNPNLRRVQIAYAGAIMGQYAYSIAVSVYAYHHGGAAAVGLVAFVRLTAAALIAPFAASLADRHRRERVMLVSDLARAVCVAAASAAVFAGGPPLVVYALATMTTIGGSVFRPAEASLLPMLARTPEELTAANVSSSSLDSLGSFVGPTVAGFLLAVTSPATVFAVMAGCFLWSGWNIAKVRPERQPDAEERHEGGFRMLTGGFRAIGAEPRLRLLIGLYGAQCVVAGAMGVLVVVIALDLLSIGNSGVGFLEAASGIGSLLGAGVALALVTRGKLARDFAFGIVLWGAPLVVLGLVPGTVVALLAMGLAGLGNTLVDVSAITLLQRTAPPAVAGRVFGVLESTIVGGLALGTVVAPALDAAVGTRVALAAVGSLLPILAVLTWRKLAEIDRGATVPRERVEALRPVPFLAPLPLGMIEQLAARLEPVTVAAGSPLFAEGDDGDRFYVVQAGELEVLLDGGAKIEGPGSYVGEIALLHDVPRTATVRARTDAQLWALDRDSFLGAVNRHSGSRDTASEVVGARLGYAPTA